MSYIALTASHKLKNKTVILLFTRTPEKEARVKNFVSGHNPETNLKVARELLAHSQQTLEKSGIPYRILTSVHQYGENFGDRLGNAFAQMFREGFENVIAIGNDSPNLKPGTLRKAAALLENQDSVLGPARDGGAYLIGLKSSSFDQKAFSALAWETAFLFGELYQLCGTQNSHILPRESDVDSAKDWKLLLRELQNWAFSFVKKILALLACPQARINQNHPFILQTVAYSSLSQRGPPSRI